MTWLDFGASVVDSLAWPVISLWLVAFIVSEFKEPLRSLISRLRDCQPRPGRDANGVRS